MNFIKSSPNKIAKSFSFQKISVSIVIVSLISIFIGAGIVKATASSGGLRILGLGILDNTDSSSLSIDPNNRQLIASDGVTPALNWNTGNVLIGTTTDDGYRKLQVSGSTANYASTQYGDVVSYIIGNDVTNYNAADATSLMAFGVAPSVGYSYFQSYAVNGGTDLPLDFYVGSGSPSMRLATGGDVLIGTATDSLAKLQVEKDGYVFDGHGTGISPNVFFSVSNLPLAIADKQILFGTSDGSAFEGGAIAGNYIWSYGNPLILDDYSSLGIHLQQNAVDRLLIAPTTGNVLIGTATDDGINKLQVNGAISAVLTPYADDSAAGTGGLTTGMMYQTDGSGSAPLNVAGIVMIKQ